MPAMRAFLTFMMLSAVLLAGCSNTSSNATPINDSVTITDPVVGTGAVAAQGKSLTVNYTGTLTNGTVFDSSASHGTPFTFTLGAGQVIKGWDQGLVGMKVGGTRQLTIPPDLGYGAAGSPPTIPGNATLIFSIQLLSVN